MKTLCCGFVLYGSITGEYWMIPLGLGFLCLFMLIDWLADRWDEDNEYY